MCFLQFFGSMGAMTQGWGYSLGWVKPPFSPPTAAWLATFQAAIQSSLHPHPSISSPVTQLKVSCSAL